MVGCSPLCSHLKLHSSRDLALLTISSSLDLDLLGRILLLALLSRSGWRLRLALHARTLLRSSVRWSDNALLALLSWRRSGLLGSFLALLVFAFRSASGFDSFSRLGLWSSGALSSFAFSIAFAAVVVAVGLGDSLEFGQTMLDGFGCAV